MNNTDKVYLIKWVGPFSYDELYKWEKKWLENNNENFNLTEYREIKINEIGTASYTMSPKQWIQRTNAIGLISKGGKYSIGTYAHPDLAFELQVG